MQSESKSVQEGQVWCSSSEEASAGDPKAENDQTVKHPPHTIGWDGIDDPVEALLPECSSPAVIQ